MWIQSIPGKSERGRRDKRKDSGTGGWLSISGCGFYANAHRGKVRKAGLSPLALRMSKEELKPVPSKGWAAMIWKVYEVDPMICLKCGGTMKAVGASPKN